MKRLIMLTTVLMMSIVGCQEAALAQERSIETSEAVIETTEMQESEFPEVMVTAAQYESTAADDQLTVKSTGNAAKAEEANLYYAYLQELERIENSLIDQATDTQRLNAAAAEILKMWDDELNSIYQTLKSTLPATEFEQLQQVQRDWITYKQNEVEKVRQEWLGGSGEYSAAKGEEAELTKIRVYELAERLYGPRAEQTVNSNTSVFNKDRVNQTNYINGSDELAFEISFNTTQSGDIVFSMIRMDGYNVLGISNLTVVDQNILNYKNDELGWDINFIWDTDSEWTFTLRGQMPGYENLIGCEFGEPNKLNAS